MIVGWHPAEPVDKVWVKEVTVHQVFRLLKKPQQSFGGDLQNV